MYRQSRELCGCIYKVQHSLPSSAAEERLSFMGATILTAKRASLTSRNFQRIVFLKKNLGCLKWQGVAQDYFDDMLSTSSK